MRKVGLPENIKGKLLLHGMPGIKESWSGFVSQLQNKRVNQIVSLASFEEIKEISSDYADAIENKTLSINRIELPIKDFSVPKDTEAFKQCIDRVTDSLIKGKIVLIHCLGGIGRTGLAASCILQSLGIEKNDAQNLVKQSGSGAETQEQLDFIANYIQ